MTFTTSDSEKTLTQNECSLQRMNYRSGFQQKDTSDILCLSYTKVICSSRCYVYFSEVPLSQYTRSHSVCKLGASLFRMYHFTISIAKNVDLCNLPLSKKGCCKSHHRTPITQVSVCASRTHNQYRHRTNHGALLRRLQQIPRGSLTPPPTCTHQPAPRTRHTHPAVCRRRQCPTSPTPHCDGAPMACHARGRDSPPRVLQMGRDFSPRVLQPGSTRLVP